MSPLENPILGLGLTPEEANKLWQGPTEGADGVITHHNAMGVEPADRKILELAYAAICTAERQGRSQDPENLRTVRKTVAEYTTSKLVEVA